jgi:hypothetical protein
MRRYARILGYAYAIYVTINLALFSARNPPPQSEMIFAIAYIVFALALSWGTAVLLSRHKEDLTWSAPAGFDTRA